MVKLPLALEHALLGLLWDKPLHAYEIHRSLQEHHALGQIWHLKQSHCYALLGRLEAEGYLASTTEPQGSRPPRKVLRLTERGRQAFGRWLHEPVTHGRDFRQEFLAKLFFTHQHPDPAVLAQLLSRQRTVTAAQLADLQAQAAAVDPHSFDHAVLQFRIGQIASILAWLESCATTLAAPVPTTSAES
jgi:DNA-binding PadR family transcriptional regulator